MPHDLARLIDRFSGRRVLLAGDFMLDRYIIGETDRNNPEAPQAPVLRAREREERVGGAGFVALSILALGGRAACFGAIGNDPAGLQLVETLQAAGADVEGLLCVAGRPTTVKTRFLRRVAAQREGGAHGEPRFRREHLLRVDEEDDSDLTPEQSEWLISRLRRQAGSVDVIVLQDYAKGVLTAATCAALIAAARAAGKAVLVDPARLGGWDKYAGATLLKPNQAELETAAGHPVGESDLDAACHALIDRLRLEAILVTLGPRGARLVRRGQRGVSFPVAGTPVVDPVGAGDAALAALSLAVAARATFDQAAALAVLAGDLEVGKPGCVPIEGRELKAHLERGPA